MEESMDSMVTRFNISLSKMLFLAKSRDDHSGEMKVLIEMAWEKVYDDLRKIKYRTLRDDN